MGSYDRQICSKCVMDITVPNINFDSEGICNFCHLHDKLESRYPLGEKGEKRLNQLINEIKRRGKNKKYDCIIGVSGGVDSTYCAYLAKKWGLRVLAVHLDNGWNSEEAAHNIKTIADKLGFNSRIEKVDWPEFKQLQIAFLKASVPDIEIPTDIGIYATLYKVAAEKNIVSIINGHSFRQEGTQPVYWTYMDGRYIESVYKKFTGKRLKYFNNLKMKDMFYYSVLKRIKEYRPLEYIDYDKKQAAEILKNELGWRNYGGHHFESVYTRFVASYILPQKFNIDKRKVSLSAKIRSMKLLREEALEILNEPYYPIDMIEKDKDFILNRLELSEEEFNTIMKMPLRSHFDYPNYRSLIKKFRWHVKLATNIGLIPIVFYEKYVR